MRFGAKGKIDLLHRVSCRGDPRGRPRIGRGQASPRRRLASLPKENSQTHAQDKQISPRQNYKRDREPVNANYVRDPRADDGDDGHCREE